MKWIDRAGAQLRQVEEGHALPASASDWFLAAWEALVSEVAQAADDFNRALGRTAISRSGPHQEGRRRRAFLQFKSKGGRDAHLALEVDLESGNLYACYVWNSGRDEQKEELGGAFARQPGTKHVALSFGGRLTTSAQSMAENVLSAWITRFAWMDEGDSKTAP